MLQEKDLKKMTVNDLKNLCVSHGLDTSGLKNDLIQRLLAAQSDIDPAPAAVTAKEADPTLPEPAAVKETGNGTAVTGVTNGTAADVDAEAADAAPAKKHSAIVFQPAAQATTTVTTAPATTTSAAAVPVPSMSVTAAAAAAEEERLKQRAARFGIVKETDRLKARAERFGLPNDELDAEKKRKRADRFDIPIPEREEEKKKQRALRFGNISEADKRAARSARFKGSSALGSGTATTTAKLSSEEEGKRKARAERFAAKA